MTSSDKNVNVVTEGNVKYERGETVREKLLQDWKLEWNIHCQGSWRSNVLWLIDVVCRIEIYQNTTTKTFYVVYTRNNGFMQGRINELKIKILKMLQKLTNYQAGMAIGINKRNHTLNTLTMINKYHITLIESLFDQFSKARCFRKLDLS